MITKLNLSFKLAHDSGDYLHDCIELARFLDANMPEFNVSWESCKSDFGYLKITSERDSRE